MIKAYIVFACSLQLCVAIIPWVETVADINSLINPYIKTNFKCPSGTSFMSKPKDLITEQEKSCDACWDQKWECSAPGFTEHWMNLKANHS